VGISSDQIFGPVALPNRLTGAVYHRVLANDFPVLSEHVPLDQRQYMWFMYDGAPSHFVRFVRQHVNQILGEQWIGRGGSVNWPARSPDLNALEFLAVGHLKASVYLAPINDLEVLQQRVEYACQKIRVKPEFSTECAPLCAEELKVALKCMGTPQSISCTDHTNIGHISAGTVFWT
jgi:hypothetical protein